MSGPRRAFATVLLLAGLFATGFPAEAYSVLRAHQSPERTPRASLLLDSSGNLYGTTANGGASDVGSVFKLRSDGSGFQELYSFTPAQGMYPLVSLALDSAGRLLGTTSYGGYQDAGTIFMLKTDGSSFYKTLNFIGSNGRNPAGSLILDGSGYLYGTTSGGGARDAGTVFRARANSTAMNPELLHAFAGFPSDGSRPNAALVQDSSGYLFGTTSNGGSSDLGTVFKIRPDGSGYQILHSFTGMSSDGDRPFSSLVLDGSGNLYGTTLYGGSSGSGTAFKMRTDGTGFQLLHSFIGGASDGRLPLAAIVLDATGNLYGTTARGGPADAGTVFKVRTDGSGSRILYTFSGFPNDGAEPRASLVLDASGVLFGTTSEGGSADAGTVFRIGSDGSGFRLLHSFAGLVTDGLNPRAALIRDGKRTLYGTTETGGQWNKGSVFRCNPDGSDFKLLHSFDGSNGDGAAPYGSLVLDDSGHLFGTTSAGGTSGGGAIFRIETDGTGFRLLHSFTSGSDGASPYAAVILDGAGYLYGTSSFGGPHTGGTIFKMKTDGTGFQLLHSFAESQNDGSRPQSALVLDDSGYLYGTTQAGGSLQGYGTVFRLKTDGSGYQILQRFSNCLGTSCTGTLTDPKWPAAAVVLDGAGYLYGTTSHGGASLVGTLFKMRTDSTGFEYLHTFNGGENDGARPRASLILDDSGHLYGTTSMGGAADIGTVFMINTDGTGLRVLHGFTGAPDDGREPMGSLLLDDAGNLYGTTYRGGPSNAGIEFVIPAGLAKALPQERMGTVGRHLGNIDR